MNKSKVEEFIKLVKEVNVIRPTGSTEMIEGKLKANKYDFSIKVHDDGCLLISRDNRVGTSQNLPKFTMLTLNEIKYLLPFLVEYYVRCK